MSECNKDVYNAERHMVSPFQKKPGSTKVSAFLLPGAEESCVFTGVVMNLRQATKLKSFCTG